MTHLLLHNRSHGPQLSRVLFVLRISCFVSLFFFSIQARIIQSNQWCAQSIMSNQLGFPPLFARTDPLCTWSDDPFPLSPLSSLPSLFPPAWPAPCRKETSHPSTTCSIIVVLHLFVHRWLGLVGLQLLSYHSYLSPSLVSSSNPGQCAHLFYSLNKFTTLTKK